MPGCAGSDRTKYSKCSRINGVPSRLFRWLDDAKSKAPASVAWRRPRLFVCDSFSGEKLTLPVTVTLLHTGGAVKDLIAGMVATPRAEMRLSWRGKVVDDAHTLLSYGVTAGECLHLTRVTGGVNQCRLAELTVSYVDDSRKASSSKYHVSVRTTELVMFVKHELAGLTGIPVGEQRLTMGGRTLANSRRLCDCGVSGGSTELHLACPFAGPQMPVSALERNSRLAVKSSCVNKAEFTVCVREIWPAGRTLKIEITVDRNIRGLKEQIAKRNNLPQDKMLLMHRGRVLCDDMTANYYNLDVGDTLELGIIGGADARHVEFRAEVAGTFDVPGAVGSPPTPARSSPAAGSVDVPPGAGAARLTAGGPPVRRNAYLVVPPAEATAPPEAHRSSPSATAVRGSPGATTPVGTHRSSPSVTVQGSPRATTPVGTHRSSPSVTVQGSPRATTPVGTHRLSPSVTAVQGSPPPTSVQGSGPRVAAPSHTSPFPVSAVHGVGTGAAAPPEDAHRSSPSALPQGGLRAVTPPEARGSSSSPASLMGGLTSSWAVPTHQATQRELHSAGTERIDDAGLRSSAPMGQDPPFGSPGRAAGGGPECHPGSKEEEPSAPPGAAPGDAAGLPNSVPGRAEPGVQKRGLDAPVRLTDLTEPADN